MDANQIVVTDENGKERSLEVLFTFNSEETNKKYVLYYDPTEEQPTVFASSFDDEGHLFEVESPEEWDMIEEVFHSFMAQDEDAHECGGCGCHHHHDEDHECCHDEDHECCHDEDHECCHGNGDGCCCDG